MCVLISVSPIRCQEPENTQVTGNSFLLPMELTVRVDHVLCCASTHSSSWPPNHSHTVTPIASHCYLERTPWLLFELKFLIYKRLPHLLYPFMFFAYIFSSHLNFRAEDKSDSTVYCPHLLNLDQIALGFLLDLCTKPSFLGVSCHPGTCIHLGKSLSLNAAAIPFRPQSGLPATLSNSPPLPCYYQCSVCTCCPSLLVAQ